MSFPLPTKTEGKVILLAQITAKEGRAEECKTLLAAIRKLSESSEEANTHTYRTNQGEAPADSHKFLVFEEYLLPNGIKEHTSAGPFQALVAADCIADLSITYFNEFQ